MGESLWRWAVHEFDPLLDAAFQPSLASLEKLLLLIIYVREDIRGLFRSRGLTRSILSIEGGISWQTYPELDRHRKVIYASFFGDCIAASDTR